MTPRLPSIAGACVAASLYAAVAVAGAAPAVPAQATSAARPEATSARPVDEPTVSVIVQQPTLVLGVDSGTTLLVTVTGTLAASAAPARARATVGELGPLVPQATPGTFVAEYRVPSDRVPQSAIIAVEVLFPGGGRAHATTRILLPAAATVPLRSSPFADVTLEVAGKTFGPRRADARGDVSIPVVVPPHVATGRARAVNKFGIAKETEVDLQAQDYPRVLLLAPPDAEAGRTVDVEVWAVEPSGEPCPPESIDLRASSGTVQRVGGMPGLARFALTLPQQIGGGAEMGAVALVGSMDDGTSVRPDAIMVHAGPPRKLEITADVERLIVGSSTVAHVSITAHDQYGNTTPAPGLVVTQDGHPVPSSAAPLGSSVDVPAPESWPGRENVRLRAVLGSVDQEFLLPLAGGDLAQARLHASRDAVDGDGSSTVDLTLELFDLNGTPTAAKKVLWQADGLGHLDVLSAPRFGAHAARWTSRRALRDQWATVTATVDGRFTRRARILVAASGARGAAARVGVVSNLGSSFGQAALLEATMPVGKTARLGAVARLISAGVAVGYLHGEVTTSPATSFPAVHLEVSQFPILALGRVRVPGQLPVEISFMAAAGMTFASTEITPITTSAFGTGRGSARSLVWGAGADAAVLLQPGELVIGARYLYADLGHTSNGDRLQGNSLGLVCDLGFRLGF